MTMIEEFWKDPDYARLLQQEMAIMDVTELICELMDDQGITRDDLAEKLGTSKSSVTKMLDGNCNMTIRKISDVLFELGYSLKVEITKKTPYSG